MSSLSVAGNSVDGSALAHADSLQPSWSSHEYQVPPSENASSLQQQSLAITGRAAATEGVSAFTAHYPIGATGRPRLLEPLKKPKWFRHERATILDLVMPVLVVGAMDELGRRRMEGTHAWPKTAGLASDPEDLVDRLRKLFRDASDEIFEDGMDSFFSANLTRVVRDRGMVAVSVLESMISADNVNVEIAEEALRQVGRMDDGKTHRRRLSLLERALGSPNARIRDAASIGIEAMDDPAASKSLQRAIDSERHEQLRQNFKDVLAQLQDAR